MHVIWIWCDQSPASLHDEQLLLLATLHSQGWAVNELMVRLLGWGYAFVALLGKRIGLQHVDTEDAQQDGMIAVHDAILSYNCLRNHEISTHCLQAFLSTVLRRRFRNFVRSLRRSVLHGAVSLGRHRDNVLGSVSLSLPGIYRDWREDDRPASLNERILLLGCTLSWNG